MSKTKGWKKILVALAGVLLFVVAGCGSDGGSSGGDTGGGATADTGGGGGTADTGGGTTFTAGTFQLTTHAIVDGCLDGGLDLLFMPNGTAAPYDLAHPTDFYAYGDLPKTYDIQLQDPFRAMTVTVEQDGANRMKIENSTQTDVVVDAANYGDCSADMTVNAGIVIVDNDNLNVTATLSITGWASSGDTCPVFSSDPCTVTLTMTGARR